jgi:GTPase SAR1 family protein
MPRKSIKFLGLDDAGKTSIILAIKEKFGYIEKVEKLKPTKLVERDVFQFLNLEIIRHDFGGQEQYRDDYLRNPHKYLANTDIVYYVIDVQNNDRYTESAEYLDGLLLYYKEVREYIPVMILLHKFDPKLKEDRDLNKRVLLLKQSLLKYKEFQIYFFETSIFDIKAIMDAFSTGLSFLYENIEMLYNYFEDVSKNLNLVFISLLDSAGITIGEYYTALRLIDKLKIYNLYLEVLKKVKSENKELYEFSDKFTNGKRFSGVIEVLSLSGFDFYLLLIIEEQEDLEKTIGALDMIEAEKSRMETIISQIIS